MKNLIIAAMLEMSTLNQASALSNFEKALIEEDKRITEKKAANDKKAKDAYKKRQEFCAPIKNWKERADCSLQLGAKVTPKK